MVGLGKPYKDTGDGCSIIWPVAVLLLSLFLTIAFGKRAFCADRTGLDDPAACSAKNPSYDVKEIPKGNIFENYVISLEDIYSKPAWLDQTTRSHPPGVNIRVESQQTSRLYFHGKQILSLYEKVGFEPVFLTNGKLNEKGKKLLDRINSLPYDGIDVSSYALLPVRRKLAQIKSLNEILGQLRAYLSTNPGFFAERFCPGYLSYVKFRCKTTPVVYSHNGTGGGYTHAADSCRIFMEVISNANKALIRLNRAASDLDAMLIVRAFQLAKDMGVSDEQAVIDALSLDDDLGGFLKLIEPRSPHYAPLREALKSLMKKCEYPEQSLELSGRTLRPGDIGRDVTALKKKLRWEGYYHGPLDNRYDRALEKAVKEYQRDNGLQVDGIVGPQTGEALRMPLTEKIKYVKLALAEYRKEPLRDIKEGIVINIPQFLLEVYYNGKVIERHRVIVGKSRGKKKKVGNMYVGVNQTPVLESKITRIVFKPRWYVNKRILKELEAESQGDPEYYQKQGFVFLPPKRPGGIPRVYQKPGEKNALGLVKFEFPNRYQVYLHDTPTKHLFSKTVRDFSHGCIRVQNALALARKLLELDNNRALKSIDKYLKRKNPTYVKLNKPFPIYVRYIPASTNEAGRVVVLKDIYGRFKDKVDNKTMICRIGG